MEEYLERHPVARTVCEQFNDSLTSLKSLLETDIVKLESFYETYSQVHISLIETLRQLAGDSSISDNGVIQKGLAIALQLLSNNNYRQLVTETHLPSPWDPPTMKAKPGTKKIVPAPKTAAAKSSNITTNTNELCLYPITIDGTALYYDKATLGIYERAADDSVKKVAEIKHEGVTIAGKRHEFQSADVFVTDKGYVDSICNQYAKLSLSLPLGIRC